MAIRISVLCLCFMALPAQAYNSSFGASVVFDRYDNVANAELKADKREDDVTELGLFYSTLAVLNDTTGFTYRADLTQSLHKNYDLLDTTSLELDFGLIYKKENSFLTPTWSAELSLGKEDADVSIRDVTYYRLGLAYFKRITDKLSVRVGLDQYKQTADSDPNGAGVFDLDRTRVFVNTDLNLLNRQVVYFTYSLLQGDVISVGSVNPKTSGLPDIHDFAFGPRGVSSFYAYKLDADTQVINLGYNVGFGGKQAVDFSYRIVDADAENGSYYKSNRFSIAYLINF